MFRGVSWDQRISKWRAHVQLNGRQHHLGLFDNEEDAARAASEFRREHMPFSDDAKTDTRKKEQQ